MEVDERYKVTQVGLKLARLLTTRHKFVCFDVTYRVDIDWLASSVGRASGRKFEGRGFESHLTTYMLTVFVFFSLELF